MLAAVERNESQKLVIETAIHALRGAYPDVWITDALRRRFRERLKKQRQVLRILD